MKTKKRLDLGGSDFKYIMEQNNYFVDKSLLIEEIIQTQKKVTLLPRPRRFGKTLNLSMLRYFFDIEQPENEKLFTELKIWHCDDQIKEKRGKYPVIFLTFKDVKANDWDTCYKLIVSLIADLYDKHNFLLKSGVLSETEAAKFSEIIKETANVASYQTSLNKLSEYLYNFYKKEVVILIDEYDAPIQSGYKNYYNEVVLFMRNLLSGAFKDNSFLYKGVITGILRVSKESIFSGLNNIAVYSVLDDQFSTQFGFTDAEVRLVLEDFEVPTDFEDVKRWYNGYKIGDTSDIYNPWSILNFAVEPNAKFKPFWVNTSSDDLIKERIKERNAEKTRNELLQLINNGSIIKDIEENFVFPDFATDRELLWSLLLFSGYLTCERQISRKSFELKIPNYEIKTIFQDVVISWLKTEVKLQKSLLEETTNFLVNNEIKKFEKGFKQIIGDTFSYYDLDGEAEKVYQSYVLGLLAIIGDDYIIKSNRESGEGRYDIMLIPHDRSKYGIVIEIKQINKGKRESQKGFVKRINETIQIAAKQIEENQYYKELIEHEIEKIIQLPIVFAGKVPHIFPLS